MLELFYIKPNNSWVCSWTNFFAWAWFVYLTSLKLRFKLGLFINKQTWMSFLSSQVRVVYNQLESFTARSISIGGVKTPQLLFYQLTPQKSSLSRYVLLFLFWKPLIVSSHKEREREREREREIFYILFDCVVYIILLWYI